jgi:ATP-binding cassette subfamily F protein uup
LEAARRHRAARRNQGRLTKLYEMREQRKAMLGPQGTARIAIAADDVKTKVVIDAEHVTKTFGDRTIIRDFTFRITRGDRIGVVGANGAGKSTLLKLLTGELAPDSGRVKLREDARRHRHRSAAQADGARKARARGARRWRRLDRRAGRRKHIHGYLKEFLFEPSIADAKVGTLSGGERSPLLLAREFARPSNLLVLDEPTNDLDLETLDLLQEVIADYEGTVLIVSHDRDFLDRTVTVTLGLDGSGKVDIVAGGYEDWEKQRTVRTEAKRKGHAKAEALAAPKARTKLTYKDQRDLDLLPAEIEKLEAAIARDEAATGRPRSLRQGPETVRRADEGDRRGAGEEGRSRAALAGTGRNGGGLGVVFCLRLRRRRSPP